MGPLRAWAAAVCSPPEGWSWSARLPGSLGERLLCLQGPWVSLLHGHPLAEGLMVPGGLYMLPPREGARLGLMRRGYRQL